MARRRFIKREDEKGKSLRINERIRISPVRLIDEENQQVGIVDTDRAMQMAKTAGLDLVEVAPASRPPVCRIMDYGKWKYQQKKKEAKAKSNSKQSELKEVRLRPSTDEHDMGIKLNHAREFLAEGHKVQFTMMFKGRQMAHKDIGFRGFDGVAEQLADVAKVETSPRSMGRRMTMIVAPLAKGEKPAVKPAARPAPARPAASASAVKPATPAPAPAPASTPAPAKPVPVADTPAQ
ncbi:MAG: translation initiation factor IF-3 [Phycisphaerales bacterium]